MSSNTENKAKKPAKNKLKVKSVKGMEGEQRKKIIMTLSIVGLVLFVLVQAVVKDRPKRVRVVEATFEDTTPDPISADTLTIARLQKQIAEMDAEIERREKEAEKLSGSLKQELEKSQAEQRSREARTLEMLRELQQQLEEMEKHKESSPSPDVSKATIGRDEKGNPYIVPPMPHEGGGKAVIVPPSKTEEEEVVKRETRHWSTLNEPVVLRGEDKERDNVLRGSPKKQQKRATAKNVTGSFLPMGSFNRAVILTGADFGAGRQTQSNPQPVLMRVMDDSIMPNDGSYKLKHCAAMGSGYGDMSSERVYISITRLSCVDTQTGKTLEAPLVAYVADTDGKLGLRGKLVNREGAVMARAMLAGFAEGASEMFNLQAQNMESIITGAGIHQNVNTGRAGEMGAYGGASKAMEMLADHYLEQAKSIFPVIEIDSGRRTTIVVQQGQHLNWQEPVDEEK